MDKYLKAIIATGVINLITDSLILALSIGWFYYFYQKQKEEKSGTLT
jgi:hypothetical protein